MAAAAVARYYAGERVITTLAANGDADRVIRELSPTGDGEVWITDLSWSSPETTRHLRSLLEHGARIFWIDHHRTAVTRASSPDFNAPFTDKVLSEQYSAAKLTFNYLQQRAELLPMERREAFQAFAPFAEIADDHDRWIHKIPQSPDWALAVQTLGGIASYKEILKLDRPLMSRRLASALASAKEALQKSIELARLTTFDRELQSGIKLRTACCFGYSSEVAARLYDRQHQTVVALFDLRSQGVSLRRSADCDVNLATLAESFGGGGHPAASGFALSELRELPARRLAEVLAGKLEQESSR